MKGPKKFIWFEFWGNSLCSIRLGRSLGFIFPVSSRIFRKVAFSCCCVWIYCCLHTPTPGRDFATRWFCLQFIKRHAQLQAYDPAGIRCHNVLWQNVYLHRAGKSKIPNITLADRRVHLYESWVQWNSLVSFHICWLNTFSQVGIKLIAHEILAIVFFFFVGRLFVVVSLDTAVDPIKVLIDIQQLSQCRAVRIRCRLLSSINLVRTALIDQRVVISTIIQRLDTTPDAPLLFLKIKQLETVKESGLVPFASAFSIAGNSKVDLEIGNSCIFWWSWMIWISTRFSPFF